MSKKLTLDDLQATLADARHIGFGYATRSSLGDTRRERLDRNVVAVANELGLTYEDLFHWSNAKVGRWLVDHASGSTTKTTVRRYLNHDEVRLATP